jgi:hypothetical protein
MNVGKQTGTAQTGRATVSSTQGGMSTGITTSGSAKQSKPHGMYPSNQKERLYRKERLWEILDGTTRRGAVEGICADVEALHLKPARAVELTYIAMWVMVSVTCLLLEGAAGAGCGLAAVGVHAWLLRRPRLPYGERFEGLNTRMTRGELEAGADTITPVRTWESNLEAIRMSVLTNDQGYLPARCLEWGEARRLGVLEWVDNTCGVGGCDMIKVLAKQARNEDASLGELIAVVRKLGGERG